MDTTRSRRWYHRLLVLLPEAFRTRHGVELEDAFVELLQVAHATRGRRAVAATWAAGVRDLLWHAVTLRLGGPRRFAGLSIAAELRVATRTLARSPGFTAVGVLTLALGIGLNVAVFSIVNAILLRPLPYPDSGRLVQLWGTVDGEHTPFGMASLPDLESWADATTSFAALAGHTDDRLPLYGGDQPALVDVARVTRDFFDVLGIGAALGRVLDDADFREEAPAGAVVSARAWRARFGADAAILGRNVRLGDDTYTIVGVLPPRNHALPSLATDFWVPQLPGMHRGSRSLSAIGRLAAGVTPAQAQQELDTVTASLAAEFPDSNAGRSARLVPLEDIVVGEGGRLLLVLSGAAGFVLVIAAVNVVNLLHARTLDRRFELAIRTAMGASRGRLLAHLGAETLLLATAGGVLGVAVARAAVEAFLALAPADVPRLAEVAVDGGAMLFASLLTLALGMAVGAVGAAWRPASGPGPGLARAPSGDRRGWLVALEVAAGVVLLVGAGLLLRSLVLLQRVDKGFDATGVLSLRVDLPASRYPAAPDVLGFHARLADRFAAIPGVRAAGGVTVLPFAGGNLSSSVAVDGVARDDLEVEFRSLHGDYFDALGMSLLEGRPVTAEDTRETPPAAVINRTLARRAWGDAEPIGRNITIFDTNWTVVGVVGDVRHFGLARPPVPEMYVSFRQQPRRHLTHVLRIDGDLGALTAAVRRIVEAADPELPITDIATMDERIWLSAAAPRFRAGLLAVLAFAALVLAMVGVYGVAAFAVSHRTREIGIRRALGAQTGGVIALAVGRGMRFVGAGMVGGLMAAMALAGYLRGLLFEVEPLDAITFAAAAGVIGGAALLGCVVPALRAAAVDPVVAMSDAGAAS